MHTLWKNQVEKRRYAYLAQKPGREKKVSIHCIETRLRKEGMHILQRNQVEKRRCAYLVEKPGREKKACIPCTETRQRKEGR